MKAYVLHVINDFRYEEIEKPIAKENMVLVEVKAAGVCGSDIPRIYTAGTYSYPLIPGHEFSGVVVETGEGVDAAWAGKRVGIFPLIPCKKCPPCKKMQYEMCQHYSYLGSRTDGGFAEYVQVPVWNLIELPDIVSAEQAAMMEPMSVAVHSIRRAEVSKEDTIAVCGLGTIGLFVVMFLLEQGCKNVLVIGNKEFQKKCIIDLGIPEENYCDTKNCDAEQWIADMTNGNGVEVFFDCVGKNDTLAQALNCTIAGGKIQLVGNPASDMHLEKSIYWKILRKQLTILGTWNSSFLHEEDDDWHYVLKCLEEQRIHPEQFITHRYPLEQLHQGMEIMRDKSEDYVKVMALIGDVH